MRIAGRAFLRIFFRFCRSSLARTYGVATLAIATIALSGSLRADLIAFDTYSGWNSGSAGALTSFNFSAFPGNDVSANDSSVAGVTFTGTVFSCGGAFPGNCSGAGGYLIGYETVTDTFPANTIAASGDFAAYYGNTPQTLSITATTTDGATDTVALNPGNASIFEGFVTTDLSDPILTVSVTEVGNSNNYSAQLDGAYKLLATPEAGTATMMLIGIGLIAAARIRR